MSYAKVLGATNRKDGYLEGNGYLVSWCVGHLVELAPPNIYDARYVKWSIADLPILPERWQYLVSSSTKKQFGILQKLMHRPDVDSIVNSCDAGREGELIFRLVYQQAGCKKPFSRLWLSSMEESAIREGFAHLKPSTEYDALYNAALCRERADWMVGINALLCGKVFCAHCGNRLNITSSGRTRLRADGSTVKEKRFRYSCHYNVRHPGQCDGQSGYGVTKLDAIVESIVCTKFSEILECSKSKLLQDMLRKDMEVAQKEVSRAKSELDLKDDERNALKDEMIRVIRGKSSIDRDMIQQLLDENQAAIQAAQDALTAAQNKLEEIEQENKKAENDCSNLFTWASTYQNASFQQRQAILNQFIKEVRVGRDYDIEIILNVPLEEFEEFKSHSLSVRTPSGRKTDLKQAPVRGLGTPNGGIVVFDKTSGEAMNIMPKSSAHVTLRCQDE